MSKTVYFPEKIKHFEAGGGRVFRVGDCTYRLVIPPTHATAYADAQLDNYAHPPAARFFNTPPLRLELRARFSHRLMAGTAGFGFWNHPFNQRGDVLLPPCNVWFLNASRHSNMQVQRGSSGAGFKAATLNSGSWVPRLPGWLMGLANRAANALMKLPVLPKLMLASAQSVVRADEAELPQLDLTAWHTYAIDWQRDEAAFFVDGTCVLRAPKPPRCALGFVAWVDNYRAIAANGNYEFGYVACEHEQRLEIEELKIE